MKTACSEIKLGRLAAARMSTKTGPGRRAALGLLLWTQNTLLRAMRAMLFRNHLPSSINRILIYRTGRLGDFIVSIPAMVALRRKFPSAKIVLLTTDSTIREMREATRQYARSAAKLPWLPFVVPAVVDREIVFSLADGWRGLARVREAVREFKPDAVFLLPYSDESWLSRFKKLIFFRLAGAPGPIYGTRIHATIGLLGHAHYEAGNHRNQVWGPLRAISECPLVGHVKDDDVEFIVSVSPQAEAWAEKLWAEHGWTAGHRIVAVFPGGTFPHKKWPLEKFAELCRTLKHDNPLSYIILGAESERERCESLSRALGQNASLNLAGQTDLQQLAAVLKRCALFVGNDSGPAHLASAVGCPCVTIMSAIQFPGLWEPWNSRRSAIRKTVPCQYCHSFTRCPLGTEECIKSIEVGSVTRECAALLQARVAAEFRP